MKSYSSLVICPFYEIRSFFKGANLSSLLSNAIKKISISILFIFVTFPVFSQKNVTHQNLMWYGLFETIQFNDKWYWQTEFQERHFMKPIVQHQFVVRSHIHRNIGKTGWETSLGMCAFFQNPNDPNALVKLTVPELRPHVEFSYKQKLKYFSLDHRYRAEARYFHGTNAARTELVDGFEFGNFRFRYRLQATIPIFKIGDKRTFRVKLYDEIHFNAGSNIVRNVFEQNRVFCGVGVDVLPSLSLEIGYLNWYQQRASGDYYNRNILRVTVFHRIDLRKVERSNN